MYRSLVVQAAEHLFATRGYERTKIQDVAAASGLSLGTLYSVFDGKADLLWHHQGDGRLYVWFLGGTNGVVSQTGRYLTPSAFTDTSWKVVPR